MIKTSAVLTAMTAVGELGSLVAAGVWFGYEGFVVVFLILLASYSNSANKIRGRL